MWEKSKKWCKSATEKSKEIEKQRQQDVRREDKTVVNGSSKKKKKHLGLGKITSLLSSQSAVTESRLFWIRARSMHKSGKICHLDAKKSAEIWTINVKCANHEARSTQISVICHKTGVWRTCHQGCQATTSLQGLKTASHWFGQGNINSAIFAQNRGAIIGRVSISQSVSYTSGSDELPGKTARISLFPS